MNKTKIFIMTFLVAALAVGCTKEKSGRIHITAERFQTAASNGKVVFDPDYIQAIAEWVENEPIYVVGDDINYEIQRDNDLGGYYIEADPIGYPLLAIYPGSSFGNNVLEIVDEYQVVLSKLAINFLDDGRQQMAFPMFAYAADPTESVEFKHVTGGMKFTLKTTSGTMNVHSLKVVAQGEGELGCLNLNIPNTYNFFSAKWANEGVSVPNGEMGLNNDRDVKYVSEMNFDFQTNGVAGATFGTSGKTFCVPITTNRVKNLTVVGYDANGIELFRKTASLATEVEILPNVMYSVHEIEIN